MQPLSVDEVMQRIRAYRNQEQGTGVFADIARKIIHRVETFKEIDRSLDPTQSKKFRDSLLGLFMQDVNDEQFETGVDVALKLAKTPTFRMP